MIAGLEIWRGTRKVSVNLLVAVGLNIQVTIKYLFGNNENIRKQVGCWTSG